MKNTSVIGSLSALLFFMSVNICTYAQPKSIQVEVNKNIELICTLINQISQWAYTDSTQNPWMYTNSRLMRMNYAAFGPFSKHPAIIEAKKLEDKIGTWIYLLGLYYQDFPATQRKNDIPEIVIKEIHANRDSAMYIIDNFMQQAAQFYEDVQFEEFLSNNKKVYDLAISEATKNMPGKNFIPAMEAYYGTRKDGYHIVLMPFFKSSWGMGCIK